MINITVEEIMNVIDSTSVEMYNSEWSELKLALEKLVETKDREAYQIQKPFTDEWGTTDWRDSANLSSY